jgi:hypothetical protein
MNNYGSHVKFDTIKHVNTFIKLNIDIQKDSIHTAVIAVKQNNIDYLERLLIERSTPGTDKYQQWLTFDEINLLTQNDVAVKQVELWLESNNVSITARSHNSRYISAQTSIANWAQMLLTEFFVWEDVQHNEVQNGSNKHHHIRAEEFSLPKYLLPYITTIFNVCDAIPKLRSPVTSRSPPSNHQYSPLRRQLSSRTSNNVNIPFLKEYYYAPTSYNGKY